MSSADTTPRSGAARYFGYAKLALLAFGGLLVGAAGMLVHAGWFPGGLLLALAALGGLAVAGTRLVGTRAGALVPGGCWALVVMPLTVWTRPEGDFLATDLNATMFLYGGVIIVVICATMLSSTSSRIDSPKDRARQPQ